MLRILFYFLNSTLLFTNSGQITEVEVEYFYTQNRLNFNTNEKVEVNRTKKTGDDLQESKDSMAIKDLGKFISFTANSIMRATKVSSYKIFTVNSNPQLQVNVKTPDTLFYKNNVWTSVKNGITSVKKVVELSYKQSNDHKNILGYDCIKFTAEDLSNHRKYEIWAAPLLPKTLLPFTGLKEFPYGILEIHELSGLWSLTPLKIKLIN